MTTWWQPRRVTPARLAVVVAVVAVLTAAGVAAAGVPWPAWLLFAALAGQLLTFLLTGMTAGVLVAIRRSSLVRRFQIPMGPAIVGVAAITCWLS